MGAISMQLYFIPNLFVGCGLQMETVICDSQ